MFEFVFDEQVNHVKQLHKHV